jgi:3-dehydroshikimate dehydratase
MQQNGQLIPGLVSITFRALTPEAIIALVQEAGLVSIEWGADVHVTPGDITTATTVGARTREAGLVVSSYGSYYHAGSDDPDAFAPILQSAVALGAPRIRVWTGRMDAADATPAHRHHVVDDLRRIVALAARHGIRIAAEFHSGTLSSTADSACAVLKDVPGLDSYWQVRVGATPAEALADLAVLAPYICHAHVFHWRSIPDRLPLCDGADAWSRYLRELALRKDPTHVQLEYVAGDRPDQFLADAATLRYWVSTGPACPSI